MGRAFTDPVLVVASHNQGKVGEIADLLAPFDVAITAAAALGLAAPEETGESFRANAEIKARAASEAAGLPALSDDSGLAVDALDGAPGIHSARWAGAERDFDAAMTRIEEALPPGADRGAAFVCALALAWPDGHCVTVEGRVRGRLVRPPRGANGFGYDPMFAADGRALTFGEMEPADKHAISHRADAFARLVAACFGGRAP